MSQFGLNSEPKASGAMSAAARRRRVAALEARARAQAPAPALPLPAADVAKVSAMSDPWRDGRSQSQSQPQPPPPPPPTRLLAAVDAAADAQRLYDLVQNLATRLAEAEDSILAMLQRLDRAEGDVEAVQEMVGNGPAQSAAMDVLADISVRTGALEGGLSMLIRHRAEEAVAALPAAAPSFTPPDGIAIRGTVIAIASANAPPHHFAIHEESSLEAPALEYLDVGEKLQLFHPMFEDNGYVWMGSPVVSANGAVRVGFAPIFNVTTKVPLVGQFARCLV
jgi:DNA-binding FrmR family transcriptional regulator